MKEKDSLKEIAKKLGNGDILGAIESEIERLTEENNKKETELSNAKKENKNVYYYFNIFDCIYFEYYCYIRFNTFIAYLSNS